MQVEHAPVAASGSTTSTEVPSDEAWVRTADGEQMLRLRRLTTYLRQGVVLTEVRLVENPEGLWTIWLRLSDRPGEFKLYKQDIAEPRVYKDVALAVATIRKEFKFLGTISLSTERRPPAGEA